MTAMRIGTLARGGTLILLVAAWAAGGTRLWQTSVPDSLRTDGLDLRRYFTRAELAEAHHFSLWLDISSILATVATIAALVALARWAPGFAGRIGLGPIGSGVIIGMVTIATLWVVGLPFGFFQQWWAARHGLAPHDYLAWLTEPWAVLGFEAVYALAVITLVMALARRLGRNWWIAGAPVFIGVVTLFAFLSGWLLAAGTTRPSAALQPRIQQLEARERVSVPVRVQKVSDWTKQANAFAVGMGPSTHVVLWDTLLDGRFGRGPVDVVVAHELGHVAKRHILKGIAWFALLAFPLAFLVAEGTRRAGGLVSPGAIPLAVLVLVIASFLTTPFQNAVSRRYEAEADWTALQATRDPAAAVKLFKSFEQTSLQEPSPPAWSYVLFQSHPTLAQRIAMAERFSRAAALPAGS
jgi:STE24 endopeptidase